MNKSILTILLFLTGLVSYAQNSFTVSLKLADEKTKEPVPYATVSLTVKGEEKAAKYVLSSSEGEAEITKVKKNTYILKAELMGYKAYTKEIAVSKDLDLGTISMSEDSELIDAASVSAVGNPIVVKKDTIEYNASSF